VPPARLDRIAERPGAHPIGPPTLAPALLKSIEPGKGVRVRIRERPHERDIEGVKLDTLRPGSVCDVSAALGTWLIVQGYAVPEMRRTVEDGALERRRTRGELPDRRRK
jgi:hypothetical protein